MTEKQAVKILSEMLTDRGYIISDQDHPYILKATKADGTGTILCFNIPDEKLKIQNIKDKMAVMNKEGSNKAIIIYQAGVTPSAKKALTVIDHDIELFHINELQLNITKHRLVPRHEVVSDVEECELLETKYKGKLPTILTTDPVSKYYNFRKGSYIRITRKDGLVSYRQVK